MRVVPHHDADALAAALRRSRRRPVVLVDGVSPASGEPAPLRDYVELAGARGGLVVIDDTQAIGILGAPGGQAGAWGRGGGGSLAFHRLGRRPDVLVVASAAKALGVPVAAVSGARRVVARYLSCADTWVHSSPVSAVAVAALDHALDENRDRGEELRARLAFAVDRLVAVLGELGLPAPAAPFPIVRLPRLPGAGAVQLQSRLLERGVRTAVVADGRASRVVFLVTARHGRREIDAVGPALAGSWPAAATVVGRMRERAA